MIHSRVLGPAAGIPWRPVAALTSVGLLLLGVAATWTTSAVAGTALVVGVAALAAATAYVLDEAATEAVAATPTSLGRRTRARLLVVGAVLVVGSIGVAALAVRSGLSARLGVMVWLTGCVFVAVAAAAALRRHVPEPGDAVGGALLTVVIALAVVNPLSRWVDVFPSEPDARWASSFVLWGGVGAVCLAVLTRASRDPLD
ncbi:hypothetical protein ASH01_17030 [Terrabacter sp. Soil811]|uniref:hypothetical protein n=1 Tax=Terrabacter sp. Soil811 TaxID=1736419 RepID=UPI0006F351CD|nr:hypothetical protein [Terrabacter sp. Soil811]KRF42526.1 hypothetical protein ASH01_17030 [Terrabacter sp. Soil811]